MRISVIGGSEVDPAGYRTARRLGSGIVEAGHEVVCGGLTGVMEAACRGAVESGGHPIGILPGDSTTAANDYVATAIATGLGRARNVLVVMNGAAAVAVVGGSGTLSEIGHALDLGRPVAGIDTHPVDGVEAVGTPAEAIAFVESAVGSGDD